MEHQPTGGCGGVNVLGQRPKTSALRLDRVHDIEKVTQGPRKAVILGDDDHVALAQLIEQAVQLGPAAGRAGDLVSKYLLCTRRLQGIELAVQVLVLCADAGVSDDHAALCQNPPKTAKVLSLVFVQPKPLMRGRAGGQGQKRPLSHMKLRPKKTTRVTPLSANCGGPGLRTSREGFDHTASGHDAAPALLDHAGQFFAQVQKTGNPALHLGKLRLGDAARILA
jgi:hypothetical protein